MGFEFHSYGQDLVQQILVRYLAGASLEKISIDLDGVAFAQAQRIVDEAVVRGVLLPEEKHAQGCPNTKRMRATEILEKYPKIKPIEVARLVGCGESTVWRAKKPLGE